MASVSRAALLALGGLALFSLILLRQSRRPPAAGPQAAFARLRLEPPSPEASPRPERPEEAEPIRPIGAMEIKGILPKNEPAPSQSFSGDIFGLEQPGGRQQAEAYLRRLSSMSRKLESGRSDSVRLEGEVAPLLQAPPKGGSAIDSR